MTSEGFVRHAEQTIESENTRDCTITVSQRSKLNQGRSSSAGSNNVQQTGS